MSKKVVPASAINQETLSKLKNIKSAEIILGVPAYENERTVGKVVSTLSRGVKQVFPDRKAVMMVSDGNSDDATRQVAREAEVPDDIPLIVTTYRGISGKGSALRSIFEAGTLLDVEAGMVVDADVRQWPSDWTNRHLGPVLENSMDLMTPRYRRHKYDATITKSVCFPLTSVLYGKRIRQPIGGDFSLSGELMQYYVDQDEWDTDVARFGIDIWMTTSAICEGFEVGETNLGAKIHDPKDPGQALGKMFEEVVGTLFRMAGRYREEWWNVSSIEPLPEFGDPLQAEPEPVPVNRVALREKATEEWEKHKETIRQCLSRETFDRVETIMDGRPKTNSNQSFLPPKIWIHVLYDYLVSYNLNPSRCREVMSSLVPLYFARTWTLYHEMDPFVNDEAEVYFQELVEVFLEEKSYLRGRWEAG